ncbi:isoamyl acetate-hydrolyzing esterase 1 homolog isoform X3 [Crotalus tigris]|uniref:isoamyl acetate-hydrolyzing esterase 1 homolog isoform X3 n=1 Tax=Crotalus tigris TaxID=88082 RepID=UPI00192F872A|nr:isoamyl acetate-hydrolyzing esterase 1 homolog isoform X3 [Crotalus tigris]
MKFVIFHRPLLSCKRSFTCLNQAVWGLREKGLRFVLICPNSAKGKAARPKEGKSSGYCAKQIPVLCDRSLKIESVLDFFLSLSASVVGEPQMSRRSTRKTLRFGITEALPRCKIRGSVFRKRARMPQPPAQLLRPLAHSHSAHTNTQTPRGGVRPAAATAKLKAWLCWKRRLPGGSFCCPGSCFSETPLLRKCDVLNRGLSGYNTRWAKIVLPRLINKDHNAGNTLAVTIFFGANDSALKGC